MPKGRHGYPKLFLMLYSMTGYGRAVKEIGSNQIMVEIRSLNSRYFDLKIRVPQNYREKEIELRKLMSEELGRGKIEFNIEIIGDNEEEEYLINSKAFNSYYDGLTALAKGKDIQQGDLLHTISLLPNVVVVREAEVDDEQWKQVRSTVTQAIKAMQQYRLDEGNVLDIDFKNRVSTIRELLEQVAPFEQPRIEKVKARLMHNMEEWLKSDKVDQNRMEQELIYYLEKYDLTEEKVRLRQHCDYFVEQLENKTMAKGKKLGFIVQEMGREINTLGSKANSADIQRLVVQMKDELEKIKEQIANIL